jgi:RND family efflux transporter MFP subunit
LIASAGVMFLGLGLGCSRPSTAGTKADKPQSPAAEAPGRIIRPERKTVVYRIEQPGYNIEAFQETALFARITGYIGKWNVDIGDRAGKSDVLAELHVPEMQADVKQKEAGVRQATAQAEQARASVLNARAQLERSKSQYERLSKAEKSGVLDRDAVEEIRLGYESAKAGLEKAEADVTAAQANVEAARAALEHARTMLEYAQIRAPYDGVITQRNVNTGDFVMPAATGARSQPLFVISQLDPVRVFVNVPGADAPWVRDGDAVALRLQGAGGEVFHGKVTRNARSLNPQSRTLRTEIDLPNAQRKLLPGMYVQATITVEHPNVWTLPASAIVTEGEQTYCYRVEDGKAVRLALQLGLKGGGLVEVLKKQVRSSSGGDEGRWEGLTGEEDIVASGTTVSEEVTSDK